MTMCDIYKINDGAAVIVPQGANVSSLPKDIQDFIRSASQSLTRDIDGSCIGLDKESAKAFLKSNGYYINKVCIDFTERV